MLLRFRLDILWGLEHVEHSYEIKFQDTKKKFLRAVLTLIGFIRLMRCFGSAQTLLSIAVRISKLAWWCYSDNCPPFSSICNKYTDYVSKGGGITGGSWIQKLYLKVILNESNPYISSRQCIGEWVFYKNDQSGFSMVINADKPPVCYDPGTIYQNCSVMFQSAKDNLMLTGGCHPKNVLHNPTVDN